MYKILFLLGCLLLRMSAGAVTLQFIPQYNGQQVVFEEKYYPLASGDSVAFDVLKFYISDIVLYKGDKPVYKEMASYHLLNVSDGKNSIELNVPQGLQFDRMDFHLGIDSATSTSGAMGGDLDPAKGMYWAWQSGYINLKLEGRSNVCATRNHEFSFHLGGYLAPGYALQNISIPATGDLADIHIELDKFLQNIDLQKENEVMIPGRQAVVLAHKMAKSFSGTVK